ncbi:MAG TPA: SAM-dependent chlorinase/fluorinase, partial [Thermoplasmata archaeon]|nr:SAM-dependent chlorinase/fluorinase [Thermoplasmata archaeon]
MYTLTTDFGSGEYVGSMKGVLLSLDPDATIIDLDHHIRPQDIRHGAYVLRTAAPHFPFAVHVGVVDPGVGTERRGVVVV